MISSLLFTLCTTASWVTVYNSHGSQIFDGPTFEDMRVEDLSHFSSYLHFLSYDGEELHPKDPVPQSCSVILDMEALQNEFQTPMPWPKRELMPFIATLSSLPNIIDRRKNSILQHAIKYFDNDHELLSKLISIAEDPDELLSAIWCAVDGNKNNFRKGCPKYLKILIQRYFSMVEVRGSFRDSFTKVFTSALSPKELVPEDLTDLVRWMVQKEMVPGLRYLHKALPQFGDFYVMPNSFQSTNLCRLSDEEALLQYAVNKTSVDLVRMLKEDLGCRLKEDVKETLLRHLPRSEELPGSPTNVIRGLLEDMSKY